MIHIYSIIKQNNILRNIISSTQQLNESNGIMNPILQFKIVKILRSKIKVIFRVII